MSDDAPVAAGRSLVDGQVFGGYQIVRLLGKGGMGEVYEALHEGTGRRVALKVMGRRLDSETDRKRFLREGRLAASVSHPNVVYVFGSEEIDDRPVIAMEYVEQGTLRDRVRETGPRPVTEAVTAILQIIDGLETAESIGVLHRDITPSNCFLASDGTAKVGDFGLSISTQARPESALTVTGSVLGTPSFASPEQLRGDPLDVRSDIYSVGATLYYLLTGEKPFEGKEVIHLISRVLQETPRPPSDVVPGIPKRLSRVVQRCLAKAPESRYPDYDALRRALLPFGSRSDTPATPGRRFTAQLLDLVFLLPLDLFPGMVDAVNNVLRRTPADWARFVAYAVPTILYFAIAEGLWRATPGKALVGLRVTDDAGNAPGIGRALGRSLLVNGPEVAAALVLLLFVTPAAFAAHPDRFGTVTFLAALLPVLFFLTARRDNGYRALHDRITNTRVFLRRPPRSFAGGGGWVRSSRPVPAAASVRATAVGSGAHSLAVVGPYEIVRTLADSERESVVLGHDPALDRNVLLVMRPSGPPASQERRDLARPMRVRWLDGGRDGPATWDAFELPDGFPLLTAKPGAVPWPAIRGWLHELTLELEAGMSQPTTAARAGTDRLWVTATGRLVLLDWRTLDDGEGGDPLPIDDVAALQAFLLAVARAGAGRGTEAGGKGRLPATPMSMGDIELLSRLEDRKFGSAGQILDALRNLSGRPVRISTARRIASVGVPLALVGLVAASIVALDPDERAWARAYPDLPSPDAVVSYYRSTAMEDSAKRKAVEVLVATRYREALTDTSFWAAPGLSRRVVRERPRIERMLEERAEPTPADSAAAEAILKGPLRWDARLLRSSYGVGFVLVAWSAITVLSMLGILGTGRVPGLRLFGMSIIDRRGRRASRLRKLARSALGLAIVIAGVTASVTLELLARRLGQAASRSAWFPVGGIGRVFLAVHHVWPFAVSALLFALVIFLLAYRWPTRAPQDWITRTRLVPD